MPIEFTQIFVRPSVDVPWIYESWTPEFRAEHAEYINTKYGVTGKRTGSFEVSENGLMLTQHHSFASAEAHAEFSADPYIQEMLAKRNEYNEANNIYSFV
jgi:hypothetical protein